MARVAIAITVITTPRRQFTPRLRDATLLLPYGKGSQFSNFLQALGSASRSSAVDGR